jgi:hypothetical protein
MNLNDRTREFHRKRHAAEDAVQRYCTPVYGVDDKSQPYVVGSGTLLDIGDLSFLVTAAHVLDENANTTLYLPGNPLVSMEGRAVKTQAPLENRKSDTIDLAIVRIDRGLIDRVVNVSTISIDQIDPTDTPQPLTSYGFVGYPSSQNKPKPKRQLRLSSYILGVLPMAPERYADVGAHPSLHFAGNFDRSQVMNRNSQRVTAPNPEGMSGGGVWRLGTYADIEHDRAIPKLIAVGIEHHADRKLLLGVRAAFVIESLRECFPEIAALLPEPPSNLKINVVCA